MISRQYKASRRIVDELFLQKWSGVEEKSYWNRIDGKSHHTPLSDRLFGIFTEWSKSFAGLLPDFELMFERFEMLGALAHLEQNKATDVVAELNKNEFVWIPLGRAAWHSQNREKLIAEIQSEPMKAALVKAGFAQSNPAFVELFISQWNDDDYDVLADGAVVGRIFKAAASPVGSPWMWTLAIGHHEDRTPTHGYAATREAAMAAFAKSWRRE